ncbi:LpxI family protein [Thalassovita taeanensis]|uniref:Phosphatidate cytidylyltransferase n=1 Tax=Thalassovita taeanensis TaxID=657014 RepID=A0A1H8ZI32_9RHOB|nr:UDP-2,3-diacylglucosamine diphosphatase LpxI [Thalassovita taeanensis]SEP63897.1 hypothetical protein SAMN04488092_101451 [Thalassovita taeanensis]
MAGRLAILAGSGALPAEIAAAQPEALCVAFDGVAHQVPGAVVHQFEALGAVFDDLRAQGVGQVVLAGSMARPPLDPAKFDPVMLALAPRLLAAMQGGDDTLLRLVITIFEEQGFDVLGAHEVLPGLTAEEGLSVGAAPTAGDLDDADRAADILDALAPVDVGQGAVVAGGLCLGIETIQGTDALLEFVAKTPPALRRGARGVFVKAAKRGQDLRVDMPAIGPDTVARVAAADLAGIVVQAEHVLILERKSTLDAIEKAGLFLLSRVL